MEGKQYYNNRILSLALPAIILFVFIVLFSLAGPKIAFMFTVSVCVCVCVCSSANITCAKLRHSVTMPQATESFAGSIGQGTSS